MPCTVQQFGFGQSNPTFLLTSAAFDSGASASLGPTPPGAPTALELQRARTQSSPLDPSRDPSRAALRSAEEAEDVPQRLVVRCKPPGPLLSSTAHAIEREFRVLDALHREGLPVPKVWSLCADPRGEGVGSAFYVMSYIEGRIFTDVRMPEVERDEERRAW